jgi:hypothetical protein
VSSRNLRPIVAALLITFLPSIESRSAFAKDFKAADAGEWATRKDVVLHGKK